MKPITISEQMMFNTVRLETSEGTGTGFFLNFDIDGQKFPVIITNKHVVNYEQNKTVKFSLHLLDDENESNTTINVEFDTHWCFHQSKDLCFSFVYPLFEQMEKETGKKAFCVTNGENILATQAKLETLSALEELVMVGYPIGLADEKNGFPIFRKGWASSHPLLDFNEKGIGLIDMAVFPGSSGSPIFILNERGYSEKNGDVYFGNTRLILLGVLFSGPVYNAKGNVSFKSIPTSINQLETNTQIMANLGCYIKATEILEFKETI